MIANHVLEMSINLKCQCVRFKKEALFCFGGFELVSCLFLSRPVHTIKYHRIILHYYAEAKVTIHKSVNLKGVVYEPKQDSFSHHSITCQLKYIEDLFIV